MPAELVVVLCRSDNGGHYCEIAFRNSLADSFRFVVSTPTCDSMIDAMNIARHIVSNLIESN